MTARYRRRDQVEKRLADELEAEGRRYTVDLIAKKATGVEGYRVTLAFVDQEGSDSSFVRLEPAGTHEEVSGRAERLAGDPERLRALLRGGDEYGAE